MANLRIDIEGIDFEKSNITFVNGLTLEKIKISYNWLLNAKVKDVIIGENDNGIVWYFGDWYCGEWENGTWYSGTFHDGVWKNGNFYSYKLNKFDVLNEVFNIIDENNVFSKFKNGTWLNGYFHSGTFGVNANEVWTGYTLYYDDEYPNYKANISSVAGNIIIDKKDLATWVNGIFNNGLIYDAIWVNGKHINGTVTNSKWIDGFWHNGSFIGDTWHNGTWYNGEFLKGNWLNGTFTKLKKDIQSRFGNSTQGYICNWYDGIWKNGEFFSNYVTDSNNNPIASVINNKSIWHNGTWINGLWYGGHFINGTWKNGYWYNGVFGSNIKQTNWISPKYAYELYNVNGNLWSGDTAMPEVSATVNNELGYTTYSANTYYEWQYYNSGTTKLPVRLPEDDGSGYTYWSYTETRLSGSSLWFVGSTLPNLNEEIFIIQNNGYINETYQGYTTIVDSGLTTDSLYYISINKSWDKNASESGKIINYDLYQDRLNVESPIIMFHGFDFNFDFIEDETTTLIDGIVVQLSYNLFENKCSTGEYKNPKITLPLNYLYLNGFSLGNPTYDSIDKSEYDTSLYSEPSFPIVIGSQTKPLSITTSDYTYGSINDTWKLTGLTEYYPDSAISYNISNIDTFRNNIRISAQMNMDGVISQRIRISDVKIKAFYSDVSSLPIWENGNWYKGTWINGTFQDGNFSSGMWLKGDFQDGELGKEFNNRRP